MPSTDEQRTKWREQMKARYERDPDYFKKRALAYYTKHKPKRAKQMRAYYDENKPAISANIKRWNADHVERLRDLYLQRTYGITSAQYQEMVEAQKGVCWICQKPEGVRVSKNGKPPRTKLLVVDHDKNTGAIRGLLCRWCNRALGWWDDDPERIDRASAYLRKETV